MLKAKNAGTTVSGFSWTWIAAVIGLWVLLPTRAGANDPNYYICTEDHGSDDCKDPDQGPQTWTLPGYAPPITGTYSSADDALAAINAWGKSTYCTFQAVRTDTAGPTASGKQAVYTTNVTWDGTSGNPQK